MNKNIVILLLLMYITKSTCLAQPQNIEYIIDGRIPGINAGKVYFITFDIVEKNDSAVIENGKFAFSGTFPEPVPVYLALQNDLVNRPVFMFFLGEGVHTVVLNGNNIPKSQVKGSGPTSDYVLYESKIEPITHLARLLYSQQIQLSKANNSNSTPDSIQKVWEFLSTSKKNAATEFVRMNNSSPVSAWLIKQELLASSDEKTLEDLYNQLSPSVRTTSYGRIIKDKLEKMKSLSIGKLAPDFTQNDTAGIAVSLKDFKGKYVLLDFWASWCKPCREENRNLVKVYNGYKDKGFTVLGISLDRPGKKEAWMKAIHDDGLIWTNVSDLNFLNNAVAKQYDITALPTNLLIDPNGRIIAKNLFGDALNKAVQKAIK